MLNQIISLFFRQEFRMNDTGNKVFGFYQGHLRISEGRKSPQITKRNLHMQIFFFLEISSRQEECFARTYEVYIQCL